MARNPRKPATLTSSERRRKRRIRWVLGIWAGLVLIAAIAYAIKKRLDPSPAPHGRSHTTAPVGWASPTKPVIERQCPAGARTAAPL